MTGSKSICKAYLISFLVYYFSTILINLVCSPFEWPQGQVHCDIPRLLSQMQTEQSERESSTFSVEGLYQ